jgi:pimeloyl-ACP methyl ester carboxylesterase
MTETVPYDEFGLLAENAAEAGLPFPGPPAVRRQSFTVAPGQAVSAILWGTAEPELVLLHGGDSKFVTDNDVAEFRRRLPGLRTEVVAGAGHAIQSDQPLALTALISDFVFSSEGAAA